MLGITKKYPRIANEELIFYWQRYGLKQDPFSSLPDPAFFLNLPRFEHQLDLLLYLIRNENVLLVIVSEKGGGKTSLITHLLDQINDEINDSMHIQSFVADSLMRPEKLLNTVCKGFEIDYQADANKEENLDNIVDGVQHKEKTCLLVIDDGHFLPLESLQALLYLIREQSPTQMRLHIILLGDHNLQSKLSNLVKNDLLGNVIHAIELEPLTLDETKQYLCHRFNQASLTPIQQFPLSEAEIERIHFFSKGIPEQINIQAQQSLIKELTRCEQPMAKQTLWRHHQTKLLGGGLIAIILAISILVMTHLPVEPVNPMTAKSSESIIHFDDQAQPPIDTDTEPQISTVDTPQQTQPTHVKPERLSEQIDTTDATTKGNKEFVLEMITPPNNKDDTDNQPTTQLTVAQSNRNPESDFITINKKHSHPSTLALRIPTDKYNAARTKLLAQKTSAKSIKKQPLANANQHRYTVQIIGLSHQKDAREFVKRFKLDKHAYFFQTKLADKPFYLLTYGNYASKQAAQHAKKNLPKSLQKYHPWVRPLASMTNKKRVVSENG